MGGGVMIAKQMDIRVNDIGTAAGKEVSTPHTAHHENKASAGVMMN